MCGVGGVWGTGPLREPQRLAQLFGDALAHRGPDGEGFLGIPGDDGQPQLYRARTAVPDHGLAGLLIHRRLSIIDLATGDQPMAIEGGRCWIVYNGEIYNFRELRRELESGFGASFRTHSDTEVILQVYRHWGIAGFGRLNGMFAFALYDAIRRELVLARDPIGVKPLYWTRGPHGVAFASEIGALLASGQAGREIGPDRLAQFLFFRFVPAPATVWRDVHKVVPGCALRFTRGGAHVEECDFAAPAPATTPPPGRHLGALLAPELRAAVQRQLIADVPVGAWLSGGLDSSLVVAAMSGTPQELTTFAVGFPDAPQRPSELRAARDAAGALGSPLVSRELSEEAYFERLPWALARCEEPLAHPGMLLQADLSAVAGQHVKVVLTGQGADEALGGYPRHHAARVLALVAAVIPQPVGGVLAGQGRVPGETLARVLRVIASPPGVERVAALFSPLSPELAGEWARHCGRERARDAILGPLRRWWNRAPGMDDVARMLYVDVRTSLAEDLLLVADKMAMAHSLEVRVPFLDLDYLRLIESLPGRTRVRLWGRRKRIQHAIGRELLPRRLARALASSSSPVRRKRAFDVPVAEWLRGPMRADLPRFLWGPRSVLPAYVAIDRVRPAVCGFLRGSGRAYRVALACYALEVWLRANLDASPRRPAGDP